MKGFIFCLATFSTVLVIDLDFLTMITCSFFVSSGTRIRISSNGFFTQRGALGL